MSDKRWWMLTSALIQEVSHQHWEVGMATNHAHKLNKKGRLRERKEFIHAAAGSEQWSWDQAMFPWPRPQERSTCSQVSKD